MKNFVKRVKEFFIKGLVIFKFDKEKLENILSFLIPEYWANNKKSFILFWFIASFTVIFIIWASIAEVNQVVRAQGIVIPDSKVHLIQSGVEMELNYDLIELFIKNNPITNSQESLELSKREKKLLSKYIDNALDLYDI